MVKPEQVVEGVVMFAEAELLPALDGWKLAVGTAALFLARDRASLVMKKLKDDKIVSALGLISKDGLVDVDAAATALKQAVRKLGKISVDIPAFDIAYSFNEDNIETLRGYIERAGGAQG